MIASRAHSIPQTRFLRVISAEQMKATKPIQFLFEIQPLHSCQPLRQPSGNSGTRPNLVWPVFEERSTQRLRWGYRVSVCFVWGFESRNASNTMQATCHARTAVDSRSRYQPDNFSARGSVSSSDVSHVNYEPYDHPSSFIHLAAILWDSAFSVFGGRVWCPWTFYVQFARGYTRF